MNPLPSFELHRPRSVGEALDLLDRYGPEAKLLAGGTDLVVNLRHGLDAPRHVISLNSIDELVGTRRDRSGALRIGALTRLDALIDNETLAGAFPIVGKAAKTVSGPTLRSMGTLGGNLCLDTRCHWYNQSEAWRRACGFCLKKDGTICHVAPRSNICWAVYSGDLAPALLTLEAGVVLRSSRGERSLPLTEFFIEDGAKPFALAPDEILTGVLLPPHRAFLRGDYRKLRARGSIDFPLAGVAIAGRVAPDRTFRDVLVALTAIAPRPFIVKELSSRIEGTRVDDLGRIDDILDVVAQAANPLHTGGAFGPAYRRLRTRLFVRDGLRSVGQS